MQSPARSRTAAEDSYPELFNAQYPSALALRDQEQRLLGEGNAPSDLLGTQDIEWRPSRYPGGRYRHPKPINVSALKQLTRHWDELLVLVASARVEFVRRYRIDDSLSASQLWRFSRFIVTIPNYLANRCNDPLPSDHIPTTASVAFKSIAGIFIVAADMFFRLVDLTKTFTPDDLILYADDHDLFEGVSGVCAGPQHMMEDLLTLVVTGSGAPRSDTEDLARLVGDVDSFFRYALLYTKLEFTQQAIVFALQERLADAYRAINRSPKLRQTPLGDSLVSDLDTAVAGHRLQRRLLEEEGLRKRLITTLENELRDLEWSPRSATDPELNRIMSTPRQGALRAEDVLLAVDAQSSDPDMIGLAVHALVDCVSLEQEALRRFGAICGEINGVLGRPTTAVQLGQSDVERALGPTPTQSIASLLHVAVEYDTSSARVRRW